MRSCDPVAGFSSEKVGVWWVGVTVKDFNYQSVLRLLVATTGGAKNEHVEKTSIARAHEIVRKRAQ